MALHWYSQISIAFVNMLNKCIYFVCVVLSIERHECSVRIMVRYRRVLLQQLYEFETHLQRYLLTVSLVFYYFLVTFSSFVLLIGSVHSVHEHIRCRLESLSVFGLPLWFFGAYL